VVAFFFVGKLRVDESVTEINITSQIYTIIITNRNSSPTTRIWDVEVAETWCWGDFFDRRRTGWEQPVPGEPVVLVGVEREGEDTSVFRPGGGASVTQSCTLRVQQLPLGLYPERKVHGAASRLYSLAARVVESLLADSYRSSC